MPDLIQVVLKCAANTIPPAAVDIGKQAVANVAKLGPCGMFKDTILAKGLPIPGSEDFCNLAEEFGKAFSTLAERAQEWIAGLNPFGNIEEGIGIPVPAGGIGTPFGAAAKLFNELVRSAVGAAKYGTDKIISIINEAIDIRRCLLSHYNVDALNGIWLIKQIISLLEKIRFGWDIAVWITIDIVVDFETVRSWLDSLERYFMPKEIPSAEEATDAWMLDRITEKQRNCIWRLHGLDPETYEVFATVRREQLDWRDAIQYVRRRKLGEANEKAVLRQRGFTYDLDVDMAREMFWELPTIADHLHWLQRQVFDADYVQRYDLMAGFDEKFWPTFGPDLTALGMRKEYAEKHYAAHWIQPSPEQLKEFLYRSDELLKEVEKPFDLDDYERLLAEQDYAPLARKWFKATAFQVPAISYIKDMFRQGIIDASALRTYHKRLGYTDEDAERFSRIDELQKNRMRAAQTHGWTTAAANAASVNGKIDDAAHERIFVGLGYTSEEASHARRVAGITLENRVITRARSRVLSSLVTSMSAAIEVGAIAGDDAAKLLAQAGWPAEMAQSFAAAQNATGGIRRTKTAVGFLRSQVIDGTVDFNTAARELNQLGIIGPAIQSYLTLWRMQMTPRRKRRSADKVVDDVANRRMTAAEAIVRLHNLGYDDADSRLYLAEAQAKLVGVNQKRIQAQQKAGAARQKALVSAAKAADKAKADLAKAMKRDMPDGKLKALAKLGLIGRDLFMYRMGINGHTATAAKLLYEEACAAKGANCKETVPGQADAIRSGGGDGQPQPPGAGGDGAVRA